MKVSMNLQFQLQANENWRNNWSEIIAGAQALGARWINTPAVSPPFSTDLSMFEIILNRNNFVR